ncbi:MULTISPECIES: cation diffusion facilitator family transporter [Hyphobacterium]|uniref:Cation diffusion facilitator family transporter n=1 Tax=Hyphobacterium vulgare TaxID=1736751 RepID=A0ABV6ZZU1_9PROT
MHTMGHGHDHHHGHGHGHPHHGDGERRTLIAACLTGAFMIAEVIGGLWTGSLALLADAAHMLADTGALALAFFAFRLSRRPADDKRTFGYDRFQIVAAFANGVMLFMLALWIVVEAIERAGSQRDIAGGPMAVIAGLGLLVNIAAFAVLHGGDRENLNMRGALAHVAGDILGSVAALTAAAVILFTGWMPIDPILSVLIALLIGRAALDLAIRSGRILLESVPDGIDPAILGADLTNNTDGVVKIHHMHLWCITPGRPMATMHAVLTAEACEIKTVSALRRRLTEHHGIAHITIEVERE